MIYLGFIWFNTFLLKDITYSTNSDLNSSSSIYSRFWSSSSLVKGLIIVQHSLSWKNFFKCLLISFFASWPLSYNAFSKYSFELISLPFSSHNCNAKSLTTHINEGIYSESSSTSSSSLRFYLDLNCICLVRFVTSERF